MGTRRKTTSFKELKTKMKENEYFNHPNSFGIEGVDHINISIQSNTQLGKIFDPGYIKALNYPHIGKFNSVFSLWYWIKSKNLDDNIRRLNGRELKTYVENNCSFNKFIPNFKAIMAQATWFKIKKYPNIIKEIKELNPDIKLLSYHVVKSSNLRICTNYANMFIDIANTIITAVKNDVEPDFIKFVDHPEAADLFYLEGILSVILSSEKIEELKLAENTTAVTEDVAATEVTVSTESNEESKDVSDNTTPVTEESKEVSDNTTPVTEESNVVLTQV